MTRAVNINQETDYDYLTRTRWGTNSPRAADGSLLLRDNAFVFHNNEGRKASYVEEWLPPAVPPGYYIYDDTKVKSGSTRRPLDIRFNSKYVWMYEVEPDVHGLGLKLREKIATWDFNLAISGAELKSTVTGVSERAARLAKAYKALRHGDLGGFGKALDVSIPPSKRRKAGTVRANASGHLLEYQFGIVPLYQDMYNGAVHIYDMFNRPSNVFRVSVGDTRRGDWVSPVFLGTGLGYSDITYKYEHRAKLAANVRITSPELYNVSSFGFANPLHAAYSVLPNSWLFDAFLPIGSFLSQLYMPPGVSIENCTQSKIYSREADHSFAKQGSEFFSVLCVRNDGNAVQWVNQELRKSAIGKATERYVDIETVNVPFPPIQLPKPSLPFLGQAITIMGYADQRSKDLSQLLRSNANARNRS